MQGKSSPLIHRDQAHNGSAGPKEGTDPTLFSKLLLGLFNAVPRAHRCFAFQRPATVCKLLVGVSSWLLEITTSREERRQVNASSRFCPLLFSKPYPRCYLSTVSTGVGLDPLKSSSTTKWLESGRNSHFRLLPPAETSWKKASFALTTSGSIVLQTMAEEKKPLLDTVPCFGQPQSPSSAGPIWCENAAVFGDEERNDHQEGNFWNSGQWIDCARGIGKEE